MVYFDLIFSLDKDVDTISSETRTEIELTQGSQAIKIINDEIKKGYF